VKAVPRYVITTSVWSGERSFARLFGDGNIESSFRGVQILEYPIGSLVSAPSGVIISNSAGDLLHKTLHSDYRPLLPRLHIFANHLEVKNVTGLVAFSL
jgi:hypothetical protein